ncbi:MAG: class I SAM-dependent methyltransferase [Desulfotignum sp.]|nr:class I SAM-dependent methyltransferase [Desulfotignum sp.]MCF8124706.1 class I SAM-dependent methyltransferase [Desulfotignum sp.]
MASLPFIAATGSILEIGSFKGKSTIILAKAAAAAGMKQIFACDPLSLTCETDPKDAFGEELPRLFHENLKQHNVQDIVQFYQIRATDLARIWDKPLKALWIDGDHTYAGTISDITLFERHLSKGGIACFHDVLHGFDGPIRAFTEKILLSESFGECGLCGSIGWGQFLDGSSATTTQWEKKLRLYTKLSRLLPFIIKKHTGIKINEPLRRFYRSMIPHSAIVPEAWIEKMNGCHD